MTAADALIAVIAELRLRIEGLEQVNAALTAENGALRQPKPRSRK